MSKYAGLKKKYDLMENVLQHISQSCIALEAEAKKRNNIILGVVTDKVIGNMKQKSRLFAKLYSEKFYGGSVYDKLKVGCPDEFDLDLILIIPEVTKPVVMCSNSCGFVNIRLTELSKLAANEQHEDLNSLLDSTKCLATDNLLSWFEGLITSALNELPKDAEGNTYLDVALDRSLPNKILRLYIDTRKSGPAFTLLLSGKYDSFTDVKLDIDLVPCFKFNEKQWNNKYKRFSDKYKSKTFLVVPKKPKEPGVDNTVIGRYWRLSFQDQERELISGNNNQFLKPAVKLLKKLRDNNNHKIASYFIKTVFMWTVEQEDSSFWSTSLSVVFMYMMKKYQTYLESQKIPYFWNPKYNLIADLNTITIKDIANRLQRIITDVERNLVEDPYLIGKYLLPKDDYTALPTLVSIGKKNEKRQKVALFNACMQKLPSTDTTDSVPLEQLGFDSGTCQHYKNLSDLLDEKNKENMQCMMRLCSQNTIGPEEFARLLEKIDAKTDAILKNQEETKKNLALMNERVSMLEEKVKLTLFNVNLSAFQSMM